MVPFPLLTMGWKVDREKWQPNCSQKCTSDTAKKQADALRPRWQAAGRGWGELGRQVEMLPRPRFELGQLCEAKR